MFALHPPLLPSAGRLQRLRVTQGR